MSDCILGFSPIVVSPQARETLTLLPRQVVRLGKLRIADEQHDAAGQLRVVSLRIGQREEMIDGDPDGKEGTPLATLLPMTSADYAEACRKWMSEHPDVQDDECTIDDGGMQLDYTLHPQLPLTLTLYNPTDNSIPVTLAVTATEGFRLPPCSVLS